MKIIQIVFIFSITILNYATCRTARQFREIPNAAVRLSQAEYPWYNIMTPDGPGTYAFGYEIEDAATGNVQFRDEERLKNGTVRGSYGVLLPDNTIHITRYIADQYGYRAKTETRQKPDNTPLKIELQVQPTVTARPAVTSPINRLSSKEIPSTTPSISRLDSTIPASQIHHNPPNLNLSPPYNNLRDQNIIVDPYGYLNHLYSPQNFIYGLRQNPYDNTVSTYSSPSQQQQPWFPFFNWFGSTNNNNNNNVYQDQQQLQRPILDFLNNIANNNPITSFFNNLNQQNDQNANLNQNGFQTFFNNINPFNLFNNNNNNRPQSSIASLPITQGDYVPTTMNMPTSTQVSLMQQPSGQIDSTVFSNDHFLNPNNYYQNSNPHNYYPNSNPQNHYQNSNPHNYYPTVHSGHSFSPYTLYGQAMPHYNSIPHTNTHYPNPYNYYNPYQYGGSPAIIAMPSNYNKKTGNKSKKHKKKNKNKVDVPSSDSDWFQDFLDKRKESSLDVNSRHSTKKNDYDEYDVDLDEYFR